MKRQGEEGTETENPMRGASGAFVVRVGANDGNFKISLNSRIHEPVESENGGKRQAAMKHSRMIEECDAFWRRIKRATSAFVGDGNP
jgi:hypothetical protein